MHVKYDVAISPKTLSTCLTKTGKNLSSLSLLPSVANPYQRVNNPYQLVICFATALVSICVVFVRPHRYLFTILESANMFLNCLAARSAVLKERLCSTRKPEKKTVQLLSLQQNWLIFFVVGQHPHILYALKCPCVYYYHFLPHVQYWNQFRTSYIKWNLHLSGISE